MVDKFASVPREPDTKILSASEVEIGGFLALHESWFWDGIKAKSLIFSSEDVEDLTERELRKLLIDEGYISDKEQITIKRKTSGFDFVNYGFKY